MKHHGNNFDLIRFILACLVIVAHSTQVTGHGDYYFYRLTRQQMGLGEFCVDSFFIISGYLIVASYIRVNNTVKYLLFRVLRIIPALTVLILITVFIAGPLVSTKPLRYYFTHPATYLYLKNILLYNIRLYLPGFGLTGQKDLIVNAPIWTLRYEFLCYIFIAILGWLKLLNKYVIVLCCMGSIYFYLTAITVLKLDNGLLHLFKFSGYFGLGSCFYFYKSQVVFNWQYSALSAAIILISIISGQGLQVVFPLAGSYLLFYLAFNKKIKCYNFARFGDFSYGIYIYGFLVQQLVLLSFRGQMSDTLNYVISLPIAIALGALSYHGVEKHFIRLKR